MECNYTVEKTNKGELEITIEDAKLCGGRLKNFEGRPDDYNPQGGKQEFGVLISEELADILTQEGLEVKRYDPREGEDYGQPFVKIKLKFVDWQMPYLAMYTDRNEIVLDQTSVGRLDHMEITHTDIVFTSYPWKYANKSGRAFKVLDLRCTIAQNRSRFDDKYARYNQESEEIPFN